MLDVDWIGGECQQGMKKGSSINQRNENKVVDKVHADFVEKIGKRQTL